MIRSSSTRMETSSLRTRASSMQRAFLLATTNRPRRDRSPQEPQRRAPAWENLALIVDQKFRVAHHVHEQDVSYLKMKFRFGFGDRQSILTRIFREPSENAPERQLLL